MMPCTIGQENPHVKTGPRQMSTFIKVPFYRTDFSGTPHHIPAANKKYIKDHRVLHMSASKKMPQSRNESRRLDILLIHYDTKPIFTDTKFHSTHTRSVLFP